MSLGIRTRYYSNKQLCTLVCARPGATSEPPGGNLMAKHIISSGISELRDARAAVQKILRPTSSYTQVFLAFSRFCLLATVAPVQSRRRSPFSPFLQALQSRPPPAEHRPATAAASNIALVPSPPPTSLRPRPPNSARTGGTITHVHTHDWPECREYVVWQPPDICADVGI